MDAHGVVTPGDLGQLGQLVLGSFKFLQRVRNRIGLVARSDWVGVLEPKLSAKMGLTTLPLEAFENIPNSLLAP